MTDPHAVDDPAVGVAGPRADDAAAATTGSSVMRGAIWTTAARVASQAMTLVLSVVAARFLGPDGLGRQSYIAFVQATLMLVLTAGMGAGLLRQVGDLLGRRRPGSAREMIRWAWVVQIAAALAGGLVMVIAGLAGADPGSAWVLAGVACTTSIMAALPGAALAGAQRWRDASIVGLISVLVLAPTTILVLALGGGIVGMFAVEAALGILGLLATTVLVLRYMRTLPPDAPPDPVERRVVLRYAGVTTLLVLLEAVVWRRSEFFFLQHYTTDTEIALYSIAFAAVTAVMLVPESASAPTMPAFATLRGANEDGRIQAGYSRALRLVLLTSLPLTALSLALGPAAIRLLYGVEFDDAAPVLRIMLALFPVIALSTVSSSVLMAFGRVPAVLAITAVGAVLIIALNFVLVPPLEAVGAAIANSVGQAVITLPLLVLADREVGGNVHWEPSALARMAVVAVLGGLAAWAPVLLMGPIGGLFAGLVTGLLVLAIATRLLSALPRDDAAWLAGLDIARGTPGRVVAWLAR